MSVVIIAAVNTVLFTSDVPACPVTPLLTVLCSEGFGFDCHQTSSKRLSQDDDTKIIIFRWVWRLHEAQVRVTVNAVRFSYEFSLRLHSYEITAKDLSQAYFAVISQIYGLPYLLCTGAFNISCAFV